MVIETEQDALEILNLGHTLTYSYAGIQKGTVSKLGDGEYVLQYYNPDKRFRPTIIVKPFQYLWNMHLNLHKAPVSTRLSRIHWVEEKSVLDVTGKHCTVTVQHIGWGFKHGE